MSKPILSRKQSKESIIPAKTDTLSQTQPISSSLLKNFSALSLSISKFPKLNESLKLKNKSPLKKIVRSRSKSTLKHPSDLNLSKIDISVKPKSKRHNRSCSSSFIMDPQNKTFIGLSEGKPNESKVVKLDQSIDNFKAISVENSCELKFTNSPDLEHKFDQELKKFEKMTDNDFKLEQKFLFAKNTFSKILENDNEFTSILIKIKGVYDAYIEHLLLKCENKLKKSIDLHLESKNLSNHIEKSREKIIEDYKKLKTELNAANKKINDSVVREKKYIKLLSSLEKQGYPIQEIYNNLKMEPKKNRSSLASIDEDSSTTTDYSEVSSLKRDSNVPIPKLSLPEHLSDGYHQEFMSKFSEFSESWRIQIEKDKR
ncbi:unnamed protein product [Blepharisma stoltei]|uniref:Translin-associated factor X-interacting protein 1 N-terminal domain-containing protein n=1 Tax=Blepharisma stoltei TaxID=1481888 RepID=A0AAU9IRP1_9CILI|nr:unnamed protein product [Blepharisma stoltei]